APAVRARAAGLRPGRRGRPARPARAVAGGRRRLAARCALDALPAAQLVPRAGPGAVPVVRGRPRAGAGGRGGGRGGRRGRPGGDPPARRRRADGGVRRRLRGRPGARVRVLPGGGRRPRRAGRRRRGGRRAGARRAEPAYRRRVGPGRRRLAGRHAAMSIKVGTASWTDKTLIASGWYPDHVNTPEERLRYYAEQFPLVEVDSTYYTPPNERNSQAWAERTPDGFTFNIKAFSLLTQHPTRPAALYKDIRPESMTKNLYLHDLPKDSVDTVWERFRSALEPLHEVGKLGAVLFQFPQWFPIGKANKRYLLECADRARPYRICVEFRNKTWLSEQNRAETLDFLASYAVPYVCVDMPQGYPSSVPPVLAATADLAVVRFHGHSEQW